MAQTGYTPILIYASGTTGNTPSAGNLTSSSSGAELALNYFDGKLFYKDNTGTVQTIAYKNVPLSTVTGTLAVANGGTGVTTSTGTGSVVLSASPTFTGTPAAPTATEKTATTQLSTTAFVDRLRSLATPTTGTTGTLVVGDRGALVAATSTITVPASVFAANDVVTIVNNSASSITIAQGSGLTMYWVGTSSTGSRTMAQRGLATVVFISATVAVISGGGLT